MTKEIFDPSKFEYLDIDDLFKHYNYSEVVNNLDLLEKVNKSCNREAFNIYLNYDIEKYFNFKEYCELIIKEKIYFEYDSFNNFDCYSDEDLGRLEFCCYLQGAIDTLPDYITDNINFNWIAEETYLNYYDVIYTEFGIIGIQKEIKK